MSYDCVFMLIFLNVDVWNDSFLLNLDMYQEEELII